MLNKALDLMRWFLKEIERLRNQRDEYKMQFLHADDALSEAIKKCEELENELDAYKNEIK